MQKFSMPTTIKVQVQVVSQLIAPSDFCEETHECVCDSESLQNTLVLLHLIRSMVITNVLVFTKSAESTLRLF